MPTPPLSRETIVTRLLEMQKHGWPETNLTDICRVLQVPRGTYAAMIGSVCKIQSPPIDPLDPKTWVVRQFEAEDAPGDLPPINELLDQRIKQTDRHLAAWQARKLIKVKVKIDGPIGIAHFGDPHVDDNGCALGLLREHVGLVSKTQGMFAANIGDSANNWMGRLAHLWGKQSTSEAEAWALTEWFVQSVPWLYFLDGNHGAWSGEGDPIRWMLSHCQGVHGKQSARLNLLFPNGKTIRVNARHDFPGHSMWNAVHGNAKAAKMGWRDHIIIAGHRHTSGYGVEKCPSTGIISHLIRVAGYKFADSYAEEHGFPDLNIFPTCVTIIDPQYEDNDPRLITTMFDVERGADYLTWLRKRS